MIYYLLYLAFKKFMYDTNLFIWRDLKKTKIFKSFLKLKLKRIIYSNEEKNAKK